MLVVTMGVSDSETSLGSFLGTPMYWSSWSRAENVRLVERAGYRVSSATDETELENGTPVTHLWVVAHTGMTTGRPGHAKKVLMASSAPTSEVVELVQLLIRNKCVNDGTPASGDEFRNVDLLDAYLAVQA